jgi:biotin synthase
MNSRMTDLFALDYDTLFARAQEKAAAREKLTCSPIPLIGACTTTPTCRHCRWENIKAEDETFFRKRSEEDVIRRAKTLTDLGIKRIFMPSGWMGLEIPEFFCDLVQAVKETSQKEVFGLFGAVSRNSLEMLKAAGMDGFFCGLESPNEQIYRKFRPGGDSLQDRKNTIHAAKDLGMKTWSGFLVGFGETDEDIAGALEFFKETEVGSLTIVPFTPFPHTEMWAENPANPLQWARVVAVTRLYLDKPDIFSMQEGFYAAYGHMAGINGSYVFPPGKL